MSVLGMTPQERKKEYEKVKGVKPTSKPKAEAQPVPKPKPVTVFHPSKEEVEQIKRETGVDVTKRSVPTVDLGALFGTATKMLKAQKPKKTGNVMERIMPTLPPVATAVSAKEAAKHPEVAGALEQFKQKQVERGEAIISGFSPVATSPSISGALIESGMTRSTKPIEKYFSKGPEYAVLNISSEVLATILFGKALSKAGGWIKQTETFKGLTRTVKFSRAYKFYYERVKLPVKAAYQTKLKLPAERWLARHSEWFAKRAVSKISPGVVDIPEFARPTAKSLWKQQLAWELAESPKTSAMLITKYVGPKSTRVQAWVSEHWLKKITGGLSYSLIRQELRTVTEVPERVKPYLPDVYPTKRMRASNVLASIVGFIPKFEITPPLAKKQESKSGKEKIHGAIPKVNVTPVQNAKTVPTIKQKPIVVQQPKYVQAPKQKRVSRTYKPINIYRDFSPPKPLLPPKASSFKLPKPKKRKRKATPATLYGWVGLEVPVPSAKQILKEIIGGKK